MSDHEHNLSPPYLDPQSLIDYLSDAPLTERRATDVQKAQFARWRDTLIGGLNAVFQPDLPDDQRGWLAEGTSTNFFYNGEIGAVYRLGTGDDAPTAILHIRVHGAVLDLTTAGPADFAGIQMNTVFIDRSGITTLSYDIDQGQHVPHVLTSRTLQASKHRPFYDKHLDRVHDGTFKPTAIFNTQSQPVPEAGVDAYLDTLAMVCQPANLEPGLTRQFEDGAHKPGANGPRIGPADNS